METLSDKIERLYKIGEGKILFKDAINIWDIKDFIKKLKERIRTTGCEVQKDNTDSEDYRFALRDCIKFIDSLAGEDLIDEKEA